MARVTRTTQASPTGMDGRERYLTAIRLLLNLDEIAQILHQKRWDELAAVAEFARDDAPRALASTDPALFRSLRAAITEYRIRGYGNLNLPYIQRLNWEISSRRKSPPMAACTFIRLRLKTSSPASFAERPSRILPTSLG